MNPGFSIDISVSFSGDRQEALICNLCLLSHLYLALVLTLKAW